jgi:hypothetical protein
MSAPAAPLFDATQGKRFHDRQNEGLFLLMPPEVKTHHEGPDERY